MDDEPAIAHTLRLILRKNGFAVRSFTDPLEALRQLDKESPDLVLSDVMMPELSGVELALRVLEKHPACKVLLFSGVAPDAERLLKARTQAHDLRVLSKPVHPIDLVTEIRDLIGPDALT